MVHIKYKLKASNLHGIGLFTDQPIQKDEILWWGFFDKPSQMWHVDFDVSKFINHSYSSTLTQASGHNEAYLVATRDIEAGEELTQNYLEFESAEDLQRRGILPETEAA